MEYDEREPEMMEQRERLAELFGYKLDD